MHINPQKRGRFRETSPFSRFISLLLTFTFLFTQTGFAQVAAVELNIGSHLGILGSKLSSPDKLRLPHLRYFSYDNQNNNIQLLLDKGDLKDLKDQALEDSGKELLKYFLIGVTLPDEHFWVNLRPDSEENIIPELLAKTDIGKIFLEADVQLKKDTASLTSPNSPQGKLYWDKLYKKAAQIYGTQNVTIPTLTRPWIVPNEIIIRESKESAYIYKATLKVMLEQDHLKGSVNYNFEDSRAKELNEYSSELIRELILPELTKEVNNAKRYSQLRQVYYSLILARWFKARFYGKGGLYASYINKANLEGLTSNQSWSKDTYFKAYQSSFKDGEYNLQATVNTISGPSIRSYFSGGMEFGPNMNIVTQNRSSIPMIAGFQGKLSSPMLMKIGNENGMVSLMGAPTIKNPIMLMQGVGSSPVKEIDLENGSFPIMFDNGNIIIERNNENNFTRVKLQNKKGDIFMFSLEDKIYFLPDEKIVSVKDDEPVFDVQVRLNVEINGRAVKSINFDRDITRPYELSISNDEAGKKLTVALDSRVYEQLFNTDETKRFLISEATATKGGYKLIIKEMNSSPVTVDSGKISRVLDDELVKNLLTWQGRNGNPAIWYIGIEDYSETHPFTVSEAARNKVKLVDYAYKTVVDAAERYQLNPQEKVNLINILAKQLNFAGAEIQDNHAIVSKYDYYDRLRNIAAQVDSNELKTWLLNSALQNSDLSRGVNYFSAAVDNFEDDVAWAGSYFNLYSKIPNSKAFKYTLAMLLLSKNPAHHDGAMWIINEKLGGYDIGNQDGAWQFYREAVIDALGKKDGDIAAEYADLFVKNAARKIGILAVSSPLAKDSKEVLQKIMQSTDPLWSYPLDALEYHLKNNPSLLPVEDYAQNAKGVEDFVVTLAKKARELRDKDSVEGPALGGSYPYYGIIFNVVRLSLDKIEVSSGYKKAILNLFSDIAGYEDVKDSIGENLSEMLKALIIKGILSSGEIIEIAQMFSLTPNTPEEYSAGMIEIAIQHKRINADAYLDYALPLIVGAIERSQLPEFHFSILEPRHVLEIAKAIWQNERLSLNDKGYPDAQEVDEFIKQADENISAMRKNKALFDGLYQDIQAAKLKSQTETGLESSPINVSGFGIPEAAGNRIKAVAVPSDKINHDFYTQLNKKGYAVVFSDTEENFGAFLQSFGKYQILIGNDNPLFIKQMSGMGVVLEGDKEENSRRITDALKKFNPLPLEVKRYAGQLADTLVGSELRGYIDGLDKALLREKLIQLFSSERPMERFERVVEYRDAAYKVEIHWKDILLGDYVISFRVSNANDNSTVSLISVHSFDRNAPVNRTFRLLDQANGFAPLASSPVNVGEKVAEFKRLIPSVENSQIKVIVMPYTENSFLPAYFMLALMYKIPEGSYLNDAYKEGKAYRFYTTGVDKVREHTAAMLLGKANELGPQNCLFISADPQKIEEALKYGWKTVLLGKNAEDNALAVADILNGNGAIVSSPVQGELGQLLIRDLLGLDETPSPETALKLLQEKLAFYQKKGLFYRSGEFYVLEGYMDDGTAYNDWVENPIQALVLAMRFNKEKYKLDPATKKLLLEQIEGYREGKYYVFEGGGFSFSVEDPVEAYGMALEDQGLGSGIGQSSPLEGARTVNELGEALDAYIDSGYFFADGWNELLSYRDKAVIRRLGELLKANDAMVTVIRQFIKSQSNTLIPFGMDSDKVYEYMENGIFSFTEVSSPVQAIDVIIHPAEGIDDKIIRILESPKTKELVMQVAKEAVNKVVGAGFLGEIDGQKLTYRFQVERDKDNVPVDISFDIRNLPLTLDTFELPKYDVYGHAEIILERQSQSSPVNTEDAHKKGGIDFRSLPLTIQPVGSFKELQFSLPPAESLAQINISKELVEIKSMVDKGIVPSGERVKDLVAACYHKQELSSHQEELMSCLMRICKLEEDMVMPANASLKEAIVIVDSIK
ncbi:MAG: hypothetical protein WC532_01565 [Candidatus Omnitrophota bacterium]